jgi:two-component system response regulator AlgR
MFDGNLKLLIVDDEAPARSRLRDMVNDVGGWDVIGEAASGKEALELCQRQTPDVALLDIRMPGMDGLEVASHMCGLDSPPAVVFTTAFDEYAVSAFDTHAVGYLLKPVRRERLLRALEHAAHLSRMQLNSLIHAHPELGARSKMSVTHAGEIRLVPVSDVISFHADQKYVRMVHAGGSDLIDESLKLLEQEFSEEFVRAHRNSLLRLNLIERIERDADGRYLASVKGLVEPCEISRRHVKDLKARLR